MGYVGAFTFGYCGVKGEIMRTRFIIFTLLLLLIIVPTSAQDDDDSTQYHLRDATLEDYLAIVPEIINGCYWDTGVFSLNGVWDLCGYLVNLVEGDYQDEFQDMPYDLLLGAYEILTPGIDYILVPGDIRLWNEAMIMAWVRDNEIDLNETTEFNVNNMTITVNPRDFNADGVDEYFLNVDSYEFAGFMVLQPTEDGGYRLVDTPLPYHKDTFQSSDWYNSYLQDIAFEDFNNDGLPEWLIVFDGAQYWDSQYGGIYLLAWRDDSLQSIVEGRIPYIPFYETNATNLENTSIAEGYLFDNRDDDLALELRSIDVEPNNWRCERTNTIVFDWNDNVELYVPEPNDITFPNTLECLIAPAETAFRERNYDTTARLLEYAVTLPVSESEYPDDYFFQELVQYARLRLTQAYLMSEQRSLADEILTELQNEIMLTGLTQMMLDLLITEQESEPDRLCTAFYNAFDEIDYQTNNLNGYFDSFVDTRLILGLNERSTDPRYMPDTAPAMCNIPAYLDDYLDWVEIRTGILQSNLIDRFEDQDFLISDLINADFNGDGLDDWVLWIEADVDPIVLLTQDDSNLFEISRLNMESYDRYSSVETVTLPDGDTAIVTFLARENMRPGTGGFRCGDEDGLGTVQVVRNRDNYLRILHRMAWCPELASADDLFGEVNGEQVLYDLTYGGDPITYIWNDELQSYVLPNGETASNIGFPIDYSELSNEELYFWLGDGIREYYYRLAEQIRTAEDIDAIVNILDAEISAPYVDYPWILGYWKAELLREADRPDEALAEYITIYESAPESAWGMLAGLHLDIVE